MPGSVRNASSVVGKTAAMPLDHRLRAGMQVAGARVIAEPGPCAQHVVERRRRQRVDRRPARQESRVIRRDRLDGGLLQHDLGQPDPIRVGPLAACAPATAACGGGGRTRRAARAGSGAVAAAGSAFFRRVVGLLRVMRQRCHRAPRHEQAAAQFSPAAGRARSARRSTSASHGKASPRPRLVTRWADDRRRRDRRPLRADRRSVAARASDDDDPEPGDSGAAGRRSGGARDPAPLGGDPGAGEPLFRLAGDRPHRAAPGAAARAPGANRSRPPAPTRPTAAQLAAELDRYRGRGPARGTGPAWAPRSSESDDWPASGPRHCHNWPFRLAKRRLAAVSLAREFPLQITRREFCRRQRRASRSPPPWHCRRCRLAQRFAQTGRRTPN